MAHSKKTPPSKASLAQKSSSELQQQAEHLIAQRNYKDAIELYKQLVKRETRPEWQEALALAYLERAREFAAKDMPKEAVALWEYYTTLAKVSDDPSIVEYIEWLGRCGHYAKIAQTYLKFEAQLAETFAARGIPEFLGAHLLAGNQDLTHMLGKHPVWAVPLQAAEQALVAYCQQQPAADVETLLQAISLRSPFRDFRILLKALLSLEHAGGAQTAVALCAKIPTHSPYAHLARLLPSASIDINVFSQLAHSLSLFAATLHGWDKNHLKLLHNLARIKPDQEDALFKFILQHHEELGSARAQQLLLHWLPLLGDGHIRRYANQFELSRFDQQRLQMLYYAVDRDVVGSFMQRAAKACIDLLRPVLAEDDNRLRAALIQRWQADIMLKTEFGNVREIGEQLLEAIQWDPQFKKAHLDYIALCGKSPFSNAEYYAAVEQALRIFPDDVDILLKGIDATQQRKAFKKAVGYALRILKHDPIHTKAREVLIVSHLAHARKLFKQKKLDLAAKELSSAAQYERGAPSVPLRINQALLAFYQGNPPLAASLLEKAISPLAGRLVGYVIIHLEAKLGHLMPELLVKLAPSAKTSALLPPLGKNYAPSSAELLQLVSWLRPYYDDSPRTVSALLQTCGDLLKKAAAVFHDYDQMMVMCEFFKYIANYHLLQEYAHAGMKRWPTQRTLLFYNYYAKAKGSMVNLAHRDLEHLHEVLKQAKAAGDLCAEGLIMDFLDSFQQRAPVFSLNDMPVTPFQLEALVAIRDDLDELLNGDMDTGALLRELFGSSLPNLNEILPVLRGGLGMLIARVLQKRGRLPPDLDVDTLAHILNIMNQFGEFGEFDEDEEQHPFPPPRSKKGRQKK